MVGKVKLRRIIAKSDFSRIFQQKENFFENLTRGCHGNMFVGVTSTITLLVFMETWSHDNSDQI